MQIIYSILALAAVSAANPLFARAVNGRCTGSGGAAGVCIATSDCSSGGGVSITGACPNDPTNIRCCTKATCSGSGKTGKCGWESDCSGTTLTGLCPGPSSFKCCVAGSGGGGSGNLPGLDAVQSGHARTIIARVKANGFPAANQKRACQVAIATARQESVIRILANTKVAESYNYPHDGVGSDHDSVGIFQQRPGWGSVKDRMNAATSADLFLAALKRVSNWPSLTIAQAAQKVQVSCCPDAYANWVTLATNVCNAGW